MEAPSETLADRALGSPARVAAIDWDTLAPAEARRLRALGIDRGAIVRLAHRGIFTSRDPLAVEIGRMTIALRRVHALAIKVEPGEPEPEDLPVGEGSPA